MKRRTFLQRSTLAATGLGITNAGLISLISGCTSKDSNSDDTGANTETNRGSDSQILSDGPLFDISLAEWSLHRQLNEGTISNLDFPGVAKNQFGISAVEYVNSFFRGNERDSAYMADLKSRCESEGVRSVLIMCDGEGALGDEDAIKRTTAVENHYRWVDTANFLGCHSIRVNAQSSGSWDEQRDRAADGLARLAEYGAGQNIGVIVENHGGLSSNGEWLSSVMKQVDNPMCGTLPDFGNFNLGNGEWYDRYKGVTELMPFAKAVSAKSYEFGDDGNELRTDYIKMMTIVLDAGYRGYVGVEYEGDQLSEVDGILATKRLLEKCREVLSPDYS
jgi:L-ribulose-5-phosphate 3-epimerase